MLKIDISKKMLFIIRRRPVSPKNKICFIDGAVKIAKQNVLVLVLGRDWIRNANYNRVATMVITFH